MVVRRLQPRIVRHVIGMPFTNFASLTSTLFGVNEGIARGVWPDSSPRDPKEKEPLVGQSSNVYTVSSSSRQRVTKCYRVAPRSVKAYSPYPRHYHTQLVPPRPFVLTSLHHTTPQSDYTSQFHGSSSTTLHRVRSQ